MTILPSSNNASKLKSCSSPPSTPRKATQNDRKLRSRPFPYGYEDHVCLHASGCGHPPLRTHKMPQVQGLGAFLSTASHIPLILPTYAGRGVIGILSSTGTAPCGSGWLSLCRFPLAPPTYTRRGIVRIPASAKASPAAFGLRLFFLGIRDASRLHRPFTPSPTCRHQTSPMHRQ